MWLSPRASVGPQGRRAVGTAILAGTVVGVLAGSVARAEEFHIDDGDLAGLIDAINAANANDEADTIYLAENGLYTISLAYHTGWGGSGLPWIASEIAIEGNGSTIERSNDPDTPSFRFFYIDTDGDLTLRDLTLSGASATYHGGAIFNSRPDRRIALSNCTLIDNATTGYGGAIYSGGGIVSVASSTLARNGASGVGGAIGSIGGSGIVTITDSNIADNSSNGDGGGIYLNQGVMTVTRSTVSGNETLGRAGGGVRQQAGTVTIANSTVSGNTSAGNGGGISFNSGSLAIGGSTIAANAAGEGDSGGIYVLPPDGLTLSDTIVADNIPSEMAGNAAIIDGGHNIVEDGFGLSDPTSMAVDPVLGPLADNGGPTPTHALERSSPAIDAGDCDGGSLDVDQRGVSRPQGESCDIGAFELEGGGCAADIDRDGDADVNDFFAFLDLFAAGDPGADMNGDGRVDVIDFFAYLDSFAAGC